MMSRRVDLTAATAIVALLVCGADRAADPATDVSADGVGAATATVGSTVATSFETVSTTEPELGTTSTTQWTPPSITWPTTPYTLPRDYGARFLRL